MEEEDVDNEFEFSEPEVVLNESLNNVIIVDNLPRAPESKATKLRDVVAKQFVEIQKLTPEAIYMPIEDGKVKGYAFIEFDTDEKAEQAQKTKQGVALDKSHHFRISLLSEFDSTLEEDLSTQEYKPSPFVPQEKWFEWLEDERGRDQYLISYKHHNEVYWYDPTQKSTPAYSKDKWTDLFLRWSSRGSFVVSIHPKGLQLWGGSDFHLFRRFVHPEVKAINFSPCENFLVACSHRPVQKTKENVSVFDLRTGKRVRGLVIPHSEDIPDGDFGLVKWSFDDKYFAIMEKDCVAVYDSKSGSLVDKKKVSTPGIRDFAWSPAAHIFAYCIPEEGNKPARVALIRMPDREQIAQRNIFKVEGIGLHWHNKGDYLAVHVKRKVSKTKSQSTFEIFKMKEKNYPVEVLDFDDISLHFAWEPNGDKFAVIHRTKQNNSVSFYSMKSKKGKMKELFKLDNRNVNFLFWAPNGMFIVLAGLNNFNGTLEFYNVVDRFQMGTGDHYLCTNVNWDPTGRFLATYVSAYSHATAMCSDPVKRDNKEHETGYSIWSFRGTLLEQVKKDSFYEFMWRPRPPSLLSNAQEAKIRSSLKAKMEQYEREDRELSRLLSDAELERRRELLEDFEIWEEKWQRLHAEEKARRTALLGYDSDEDADFIDVVEEVEEVVHESRTVE